MSVSLRPHEPEQARDPGPSPTPGVYSNSCPLSWWCHPTISSSVLPFSYCPQSFPASGSFQMSQLFASLEFQLQHQSFEWTPRTDLLLVGSPCSPRDSGFIIVQLSHPYMTTGKTIALTRLTFLICCLECFLVLLVQKIYLVYTILFKKSV